VTENWRQEPVTLRQWWVVFIPTCLVVGMIVAGWDGLIWMASSFIVLWLVRFPMAWLITRTESRE